MAKKLAFKDLVVFENDHFLAINKPAGISSLHEREMDGSSIIELAKEYNEDLQLCHRIDKDTSGVLLLSKHSSAYASAATHFERRRVVKRYHAICQGQHHFRETRVNHPLHISRSGRSMVNYNKGKDSETLFETLENFKHYTLVEARPITGRLHQIRAHLGAIKAPIAGDTTYGGSWPYLSQFKRAYTNNRTGEELPMIQRFALHAFSLEIKDPDGVLVTIEAPYPKDFEVFLKQLRKYDKS